MTLFDVLAIVTTVLFIGLCIHSANRELRRSVELVVSKDRGVYFVVVTKDTNFDLLIKDIKESIKNLVFKILG